MSLYTFLLLKYLLEWSIHVSAVIIQYLMNLMRYYREFHEIISKQIK